MVYMFTLWERLPDSDAMETTEKLKTFCPSRKNNVTKNNR